MHISPRFSGAYGYCAGQWARFDQDGKQYATQKPEDMADAIREDIFSKADNGKVLLLSGRVDTDHGIPVMNVANQQAFILTGTEKELYEQTPESGKRALINDLFKPVYDFQPGLKIEETTNLDSVLD